MVETVVVSAVTLVSLLLVFQMLRHVSLWWSLHEAAVEQSATARYTVGKINDLLVMAGYRPSVRGVHVIERDRISLEYLDDGADEKPGLYSRHRLFTIRQDGACVKLTVHRRLLPLEGPPAWGEGATSVLADNVRDLSFAYFDGTGRETTVPAEVRMVQVTLRMEPPARPGTRPTGEESFQSAVYLRNHRS